MKTFSCTVSKTHSLFFILSLILNLTFILESSSQDVIEEYTEKEIVIIGRDETKYVRIKKGDRVKVSLKNSQIPGTVLSINESVLYLKISEKPLPVAVQINKILDLKIVKSYNKKIYNVKVLLKNNDIVKGRLYFLNQSEMVILESDSLVTKIPIENIDKVKFRVRNAIGKGFTIGAITGALVGTFFGLVSGLDSLEDPSSIGFDPGPGLMVLGGCIIFAPMGSLIGGLVGSSSNKFKISTDTENYKSMKKDMEGLFVKGPLP